ncbi:hypothetical protein Taro_048466 [Colocasia esculenta]|uniref:Uncharacterized protein n=1 Tax=Colocasia esculenta TaxID=4460 RepID=A0A843X6J3_COLES|nr:hypothetical protein [Colocasia esculenta]
MATTRSNFKLLLYYARKNAQSLSESRPNSLVGARTDMDEERLLARFPQHMGTERWQETSTIMKVNRAFNLEANKHTSGSVSFATHQYRSESYSQ